MDEREGRAQGTAVAVGVGLAFGVAAVVLFLLSWLLRGQGPSARTGVGALFAFGWAMATLAATVPLMLRLGTLRAGITRTGGATASGGAVVETRSRAPAIFIALSAVLLLAAMLLMFGDRSTTPLGALIGAVLAVFMLGWARKAWPPRTPWRPAATPRDPA